MKYFLSGLPDYYGVLDVPCDASLYELSAAFHCLIDRYYPDLSAPDLEIREEAQQALADVKEAYEVLSDSIRRWLYDQQLLNAIDQGEVPYLQMLQANGRTHSGSSRYHQQPARLSIVPPAQRGLSALLRRMFVPDATGQEKHMMGVVRKLLLVPTPFCASTIMAMLFLHLGQTTGYGWLFDLTAILCYPLILFPVFLRLQLPVRFTPKLSPLQKVLWTPLILLLATLFSLVWLALADHNGKGTSPLDIYFWLVLVMSVCLSLAYL